MKPWVLVVDMFPCTKFQYTIPQQTRLPFSKESKYTAHQSQKQNSKFLKTYKIEKYAEKTAPKWTNNELWQVEK